MANLSEALLKKFEDEGYKLTFENDSLVTFQVPYWDDSGIRPTYRINILEIGLSRGKATSALFDDRTSDIRETPEEILPLIEEVILEKGWVKEDDKED